MNSTESLKPNMDINTWFEEKMQKRETTHIPTMTIISTKGTLDQAYPPFILASTAAALGWDVSIFFTFCGLNLLKKDLELKVTPLGNPAIPMKLLQGSSWIKGKGLSISAPFMSLIPSFESMATTMMQMTMDKKGVARIGELRNLCLEADVKLIACQMTVDLFEYKKDEFIPEITDWIGTVSFLPRTSKADINLFM